MISERTLKKWRKEAFRSKERLSIVESQLFDADAKEWKEMLDHIFKMTQELLDLHLTRKK